MAARTKAKDDAHHQAHVPDDLQFLVGDRTPLLLSTLGEKVVRKVHEESHRRYLKPTVLSSLSCLGLRS